MHTLKAQADAIARTIKAAEQGQQIDARFAATMDEARDRTSFKIGIVMDDGVVLLDMPWTVIRASGEADLSRYLLKQMLKVLDNG